MPPAASPAPRIPPGSLRALGPVNWALCRLISLAAGTPDAHLFSTLGRHRALFRGWLVFAAHLMPGGALPRRETELAILRVAHLRGCEYELAHHRRLARRAGIHDALVARVLAGPDAGAWSGRDRALLAAVDSLVLTQDLDDAAWRELNAHWSERQRIELILLVGHYELLATAIAALRIANDQPASSDQASSKECTSRSMTWRIRSMLASVIARPSSASSST